MIGKRIAQLRKKRGWTQKDLAEETGLSRGYISTIEEGGIHPSVKTLALIAGALGVEARELLEEVE